MEIDALKKSLGITFGKQSLLEQALVHDSYVNENPDFVETSNERLEFLGDAVLGMVVAEKLYADFPASSEGDLSQLRAVIVKRETLARIARGIGLGDYLFLGRGEESSGGRNKIPNLAGALEAVIGAIYLDQGLEKARKVILELLAGEYVKLVETGAKHDYKSQLQETIQAKEQRTPTYTLLSATGPDHDRWFRVEVRVGERVLGKGEGKSKKAAESEAARDALERLAKGN